MNVKQITRALHTLSLLSEEDYDLVLKLRALTEDERGMLMLVLEPSKPAGKKTSKKSSKSAQSSTKSPRATGIEQQLNKRREQGRAATTIRNGDDEDSYCAHQYEHDGMVVECGEPADQNIHHLRTIEGYHPFVSEFAVPTALTPSPANGGAESTTQNSEASAVSAGAVTGGSSE